MNFPGGYPNGPPRGARVDPQLFSMQNSFISQIAAQQHAQAQHQAAQQHALAQQRAAAQQQQMINHRNAMMIDTARITGLPPPSAAPPQFPNSLSGPSGVRMPDHRNPAAAVYSNRSREFVETRPVGFMGRPPPPPAESRPYGIPTRPSPPRPKRASPPPFRVPAISVHHAEPASRPAMPHRQGGYVVNSSSTYTAPDRPTALPHAPRAAAASRSDGVAAPARTPRGGAQAGSDSDSDESGVLEGTRKRRRRPRARWTVREEREWRRVAGGYNTIQYNNMI
jgi:hypothetical protein